MIKIKLTMNDGTLVELTPQLVDLTNTIDYVRSIKDTYTDISFAEIYEVNSKGNESYSGSHLSKHIYTT